MRRALLASLLLLASCGTAAAHPKADCATVWAERVHNAALPADYNAAVDRYNACPGVTIPMIHMIEPR